MIDDAIVYLKKVQNEDNGPELSCTTMIELHQELLKVGSEEQTVPEIHLEYDRHKDYPPDSNGDRSSVVASYSGPEKDYAIIGLRKSRNVRARQTVRIPSKRHCTSFLWLNNNVLMKENILFEPWKAWEDLKICNDADAKNLNVVKISSFEFTKIHSRDNALLYQWADNDFHVESATIESNQSKVESVLMKFLKEQRIEQILNFSHTGSEENKKFSEMEGKIKLVRNGGITVVFATKFEDLGVQQGNNPDKILFIMPLTNESYDKYKCEEDFTASIHPSNLLELKIFSTHRPRVTSDYWIISISTMGQNNAQEEAQISNINHPDFGKTFNQIFEMLKEIRDEQRKSRDDQKIILANQIMMREDLKTLKCQIRPNEIVHDDQGRSSSRNDDNIIPGPSTFNCLFNGCLVVFKSAEQLQLHIQNDHPDMEISNPSSPERKEDGNNVRESRSSSPNNDQNISNPSSETNNEETESVEPSETPEIPDFTDETVQEPSDESAQEFDNQSPIQETHEEATSRSSNSTIFNNGETEEEVTRDLDINEGDLVSLNGDEETESVEPKETPELDESAQEFDNQSLIQDRHEEATSRSSNSTIINNSETEEDDMRDSDISAARAGGGQAQQQPIMVNSPTARVQGPGFRANCTLTSNRNVVINQPGAAAIHVPLQTLQSMQPGQGIPTGQAGHLLVKTKNGKGISNTTKALDRYYKQSVLKI